MLFLFREGYLSNLHYIYGNKHCRILLDRLKKYILYIVIFFITQLLSWFVGYQYMVDYAHAASDFESYYLASKVWEQHQNPYDFNTLATQKEADTPPFPYVYTPPAAQCISAFSHLQFQDAAILWGMGLLMAYGLCIFLTSILCHSVFLRVGWLDDAIFHRTGVFTISLLLAFLFPFLANLQYGQINIFILIFILCYVIFLAKDQPFLAGFSLGVAAVLKIVPVFFLLCHLRSKGKFFLGFFSGLFSIVLTSVAFFGLVPWQQFIQALPKFSYGTKVEGLFDVSVEYNLALSGSFARLYDDHAQWIFLTGALFGLVVLGYFWWKSKKIQVFSAEQFLYITLAAIGMVLFSPIAYFHHLVWLYPFAVFSLVYIYFIASPLKYLYVLLLLVSACLFLFNFTLKYYEYGITAWVPFYFSVNTWGLMLWAVVILLVLRNPIREVLRRIRKD